MIDHRASGNPMYFSMREKAIARGREDYDKHKWATDFRKELANCINGELGEIDFQIAVRDDANDAIREAIRRGAVKVRTASTDFPKEFVGRMVDDFLERETIDDLGMEWAIGAALADVARMNLDYTVIPQAAIGLCGTEVSNEAFLETLCGDMEESERRDLEVCCVSIASHIAENPGTYTLQLYAEGFAAAMDHWRENPALHDLWYFGIHSHFNFNHEPIEIFNALYRVNPPGFLRVLEDTKCPNAVEDALMRSSVSDDFQEILRLVAFAPECFELAPNGNVEWNGHMTGPVLLSRAIQHMQAVADYEANKARNEDFELDSEKVAEEVAHYSEELTNVLMEREDGHWLLSAWLVFLCERTDGGTRGFTSIGHIVLETVASLLAKKVGDPECLKKMYPEFGECDSDKLDFMVVCGKGDLQEFRKLKGMSVFLAGAAISGHQGYPDFGGQTEFFRSLLIRQDSGANEFSTSVDDIAFQIIANLLAEWEEPSNTWQALWDDLAEQRRRSALRWAEDAWQGLNPSQYLLSAGLALLRVQIRNRPENYEDILSLWDRLWDALFELQRHGGMSNEQSCQTKFHHLFSTLSALQALPAGANRSHDDIIQRLMMLGGDDELWIIALSALERGHIDIQRLAESVRQTTGISCVEIVNRQIERMSARSVRPEDFLMNACQGLLARLPEAPSGNTCQAMSR